MIIIPFWNWGKIFKKSLNVLWNSKQLLSPPTPPSLSLSPWDCAAASVGSCSLEHWQWTWKLRDPRELLWRGRHSLSSGRVLSQLHTAKTTLHHHYNIISYNTNTGTVLPDIIYYSQKLSLDKNFTNFWSFQPIIIRVQHAYRLPWWCEWWGWEQYQPQNWTCPKVPQSPTQE